MKQTFNSFHHQKDYQHSLKPSQNNFNTNQENLKLTLSSERKQQLTQTHTSQSSLASQDQTQRQLFKHPFQVLPITNLSDVKDYQSQPGFYTQGVNFYHSAGNAEEQTQVHLEGITPAANRKGQKLNSNALYYLEDSLTNGNEWINIQNIVRVTFKHFYDLFKEQQEHMNYILGQMGTKITETELQNAMISKADISDVSKAVTEIIQTVDTKPQIENLKKELAQKVNKNEVITQFKTHQSMIEELKKLDQYYKDVMQETQNERSGFSEKIEEIKKEQNKKLSQIYRELEKNSISLERKVNLEDLQELLEGKADKQMLINAISSKANKHEIEQMLSQKSDIQEVNDLVKSLETRYEQEFMNLHDNVNRKANNEDFQYYRKELGFKLDKNEIEAFRHEYVERLANFEYKLNEKNTLSQQFLQNVEQKFDHQLNQFKHFVSTKVEQKAELSDYTTLKQEMRLQIEKLNEQASQQKLEWHQKNEQLYEKFQKVNQEVYKKTDDQLQEIEKIGVEITKIKEQMKFIVKERFEDISQISELLKQNQKKIMSELLKVEKDLSTSVLMTKKEHESELQQVREDLEIKLSTELQDKVRVEEVQDALRRLTDSNQQRIETIYQELKRQITTKNDDTYQLAQKLKSDFLDLEQLTSTKVSQNQLNEVISQQEIHFQDLAFKADKKSTQQQLDFLSENLSQISRELLMKLNVQDAMNLIDKKSNADEVYLDINYLKTTHQKLLKEFNQNKEEQNMVNEAICSENCVARWIWKNGQTESSKGMTNSIKWDLQSVNTCPDNFVWREGQAFIQVDSPGLYEITMAFFSKKKKPFVQILANNQVIAQTIAKSVCGACGSQNQVGGNGHIQKMGKGLFKVSLIEFVTIQEKSIVNVQFQQVDKKDGHMISGVLMSAEGFMGIRKI